MSFEKKKSITGAPNQAVVLELVPWDVLSSRELAALLGVSIQVLANWRVRNTGPAPAPAESFRGNRTYYPVYEIEAWRRGVEPWEFMQDWLRERYTFPKPLETEERTWKVARQLQGWDIHPLHHPPRKPIPLPVK